MSVMIPVVPSTVARVDMAIQNNATWEDAFQFGVPGDLTWSFTGQTFRLDIKADPLSSTALLSMTTGAGTIVVDDVVQRVLHFNVPDLTIQNNLIPGEYYYDLVMIDGSSPAIRVVLMKGKLKVRIGITGD